MSQEIGAAQDTIDLVQLPDGRLLFANLGGLLVYDGARWRFWNHPDRLPRLGKLAVLGERIYSSYIGDLGYYEPNGRGAFTWQSIASLLQEPVANLGQNMHVAVHAGQVYYLFNRALLRYDIAARRLDVLARGQSLANGAFAAGVKRFLFLGSSCIYPKLAPQPMPESCLLTGISPEMARTLIQLDFDATDVQTLPQLSDALVRVLSEKGQRLVSSASKKSPPEKK